MNSRPLKLAAPGICSIWGNCGFVQTQMISTCTRLSRKANAQQTCAENDVTMLFFAIAVLKARGRVCQEANRGRPRARSAVSGLSLGDLWEASPPSAWNAAVAGTSSGPLGDTARNAPWGWNQAGTISGFLSKTRCVSRYVDRM